VLPVGVPRSMGWHLFPCDWRSTRNRCIAPVSADSVRTAWPWHCCSMKSNGVNQSCRASPTRNAGPRSSGVARLNSRVRQTVPHCPRDATVLHSRTYGHTPPCCRAGGRPARRPCRFAQQPHKAWRTGLLVIVQKDFVVSTGQQDMFLEGMRDYACAPGMDCAIEQRFADGDGARLPVLAAERVRSEVDLIPTSGTQAKRAARQATATIPIATVVEADPLDNGFAVSRARLGQEHDRDIEPFCADEGQARRVPVADGAQATAHRHIAESWQHGLLGATRLRSRCIKPDFQSGWPYPCLSPDT